MGRWERKRERVGGWVVVATQPMVAARRARVSCLGRRRRRRRRRRFFFIGEVEEEEEEGEVVSEREAPRWAALRVERRVAWWVGGWWVGEWVRGWERRGRLGGLNEVCWTPMRGWVGGWRRRTVVVAWVCLTMAMRPRAETRTSSTPSRGVRRARMRASSCGLGGWVRGWVGGWVGGRIVYYLLAAKLGDPEAGGGGDGGEGRGRWEGGGGSGGEGKGMPVQAG